MSIENFRHKGLERLFLHDDPRGVNPALANKIRNILFALSQATEVTAMGLFPGWRLHRLKGDLQGGWSVTVSGNWRIVFRFKDGNAFDVDLIDYH